MPGDETKDGKKPAANLPSVIGAVGALAVAVFLFFSALDCGLSLLLAGAAESAFSPFLRNWLLLIGKLLAGVPGYSHGLLAVINPIDIAILILVSLAGFAVALSLAKARRIIAFIASRLPLAGIMLLAATGIAGRSSVLLAVPVLSLCLAKTARWNAAGTVIGVAAGVFLLLGDICVGIFSSIIITVLFGAGYLVLIAWLALVAGKLLPAPATR